MAKWIASDWDYTAWDTKHQEPMEGFREFLDVVHGRGHKVVIFSCNRPTFIREMCDLHDLRIDAIWGEQKMDYDEGAKPVAVMYIDDKALRFTNWEEATSGVLEMLAARR